MELWAALPMLSGPAKGPQLSWLGGLSSTPRVLGSISCWSELSGLVKKFPSSVPRQSIGLRLGPGRGCSHMGYRSQGFS